MDALRDQSVTTHGTTPFQAQAAAPEARLPMRVPKRRKDGKPAAVVRSGSVALPVYQCRDGRSTRFILSYHRAGRRLRHSFISYRIAIVKSADQVALEAGNSAAIIFKHYRELTTEDVAREWFSILPKEGQWENRTEWNRKTGVMRIVEAP